VWTARKTATAWTAWRQREQLDRQPVDEAGVSRPYPALAGWGGGAGSPSTRAIAPVNKVCVHAATKPLPLSPASSTSAEITMGKAHCMRIGGGAFASAGPHDISHPFQQWSGRKGGACRARVRGRCPSRARSDQLVIACVEKLREKSGMRDITMTNSE